MPRARPSASRRRPRVRLAYALVRPERGAGAPRAGDSSRGARRSPHRVVGRAAPTHFSSRYGSAEAHAAEARSAHGDVVALADLDRVRIR